MGGPEPLPRSPLFHADYQGELPLPHTSGATALRSRPVLSHTMDHLNGFRKSPPPKNRQLIGLISNSKQRFDDFVGELTFWIHFINTFCEIRFDRFVVLNPNTFGGRMPGSRLLLEPMPSREVLNPIEKSGTAALYAGRPFVSKCPRLFLSSVQASLTFENDSQK